MKEYKRTIETYRIVKDKTDFNSVKIIGSADAANFIRNFYLGDIGVFESFYLLLLNRSNNTTGYVKISQGGIEGTVTDLRIIAKYAIEGLATAVIIAHNHPSGNLQPSDADISMTRRIKEALGILDISVMDHLILTEDSYYSFADEGML